jgi:2-polyprenyl-6-methoxyphenol hydroxylase-like FAD-dependent oxidoreductase
MSNSTDCLIIGAGPVGLTLACQLQHYGVSFRIIDKLEGPVIRTKAAAVWSRTTEFMSQLGLADEFLKGGLHCHSASLFADGKRFAQLHLDSVDSLFNFVLMVPQHTTEQILREDLAKHGVEVEYGQEMTSFRSTGEHVEVGLANEESLTCRWLVGCDGAHSRVRHRLNLCFVGEELKSGWVVADIHMKEVFVEEEIMAVMHENGPAALFPLGDMLYRVVAQVDKAEGPHDSKAAEAALREAFEERAAGLATLGEFRDAGFFTVHERQVETYQEGRIFLAGDAAHVHSPLGGQGMNTGIHDAYNLGWKIAMVARGHMNEDLLDTYHEERFPIGQRLVQATSMGTKMITQRQPMVAALRKQAAKILTQLPVLKHKARDALTEVDIHYRGGPLSVEPESFPRAWRFKKGIRPGERAPDAPVMVNGEESRLMDFLVGPRYHLLLFGGDHEDCWSVFEPLVRLVRELYGSFLQLIWIGADESPPPLVEGEIHLVDQAEELHHDYAATEPSLYLLRPDAYVAYRSQTLEVAELEGYFEDWLAEES